MLYLAAKSVFCTGHIAQMQTAVAGGCTRDIPMPSNYRSDSLKWTNWSVWDAVSYQQVRPRLYSRGSDGRRRSVPEVSGPGATASDVNNGTIAQSAHRVQYGK